MRGGYHLSPLLWHCRYLLSNTYPHDTNLHQAHPPSITPPSLPGPIPTHLHHFHVIIIHLDNVWHFFHQLNISEAPSIIKQEHSDFCKPPSALYPTWPLAHWVVCVHALTCLLTWLTFQPINDGGGEGKQVEAVEQAVSQRGAKQLVESITPVSC